MATSSDIKKVRELSGAGMMDCKKALVETKNDIDKAVANLRKKGLAKAAKRMGRETAIGRVFSYIHGEGGIGVLLQINCETDFVARNEDFCELGEELCMQIAAASPTVLAIEDCKKELVEQERLIYREQFEKENEQKKLAPELLAKMTDAKVSKFYSEICLLEQAYIKEPKLKVGDLIKQSIAKFGENIIVARFTRYQI